MSDIDAKILCKSIDINNIVSIKLIVYGLLNSVHNSKVGSAITFQCQRFKDIFFYLQKNLCSIDSLVSKKKVSNNEFC